MTTPNLSEFSNLVLCLYRAAGEQPLNAFQDEALSIIKRMLPFDRSMWGTATNTPAGIDIHSIHLHNEPQEMLEFYEEVKHQDSAAAACADRPRATLSFHSSAFFAGRGASGMRALCERFEHANMLISSEIDSATQFVQWISLYRSDRDAICGERDRRLLELLAPHVMQSLSLNRLSHLDTLRANPRFARFAFAVADVRGVIYHADQTFEELLRVEFGNPHRGRLPDRLVAHFADKRADRRPFLGNEIVVRASLPEQGLLFVKARPRLPIDRLTEREREIARLLAQGATHKQVARALNRSPATVRNRTQVIYEKLGIHAVAELAAHVQADD